MPESDVEPEKSLEGGEAVFSIELPVLPLVGSRELWPVLPASLILDIFAERREECRLAFADDSPALRNALAALRNALAALDDAEAELLRVGAWVERHHAGAATPLTFWFRRATVADDRAALAGAQGAVGAVSATLGGSYRDALAGRTWLGCRACDERVVTTFPELPDGLRAVLALLVSARLDFTPSEPALGDILGGPPPRPHQEA